VGDLRRSFQKTIVHLGSSVGDPGHVVVTDLPLGHSRRNWRQHDQRGQIETQNRRPIVRVSSHDRERKA
jgi:hypothetical protein